MLRFKDLSAELRVKTEEYCLEAPYDGSTPALLTALKPDPELYGEALAVCCRVNARIDHNNKDKFLSLDKRELLKIRYIEIQHPTTDERADYRSWFYFRSHKLQLFNNFRVITLDLSKILEMTYYFSTDLIQIIQASSGIKKIILKFHQLSYTDDSESYPLDRQSRVQLIQLLNEKLGVQGIQVPQTSVEAPKIFIWEAFDGKFLNWVE
ncbi:hypothetical protein B7463_g3754, partial [Scytalidium lignicola]